MRLSSKLPRRARRSAGHFERRRRRAAAANGDSHRDAAAATNLDLGASVDLHVGLRSHAPHHHEQHEVGDEADDASDVLDLRRAAGDADDARDDLADAGEALQAVGKGDDAVVARVRRQLLLVHHVEASGLNSWLGAAPRLEAEAAAGRRRRLRGENAAAPPADGLVGDAAASEIALAARVPLRPLAICLQHLVSHVACSAAAADGSTQAAAWITAE
mmetsp:Transcript_7849/g.15422  ORF Transcript_7849/g.15422 Transcript_7849/m.15422 type:complete len:217 (+) Transcript_7849:594-1244(+)